MLITSAFLSKSLYHNNDTSAISDIKATEGIALSFKEVWERSGLTMMASGAVVGFTALIAVANAYAQKQKEIDDNARNAFSTWSELNSNLETQISEITRLKTALDEGSLSEQEAYNAKSQLYDIQNQLHLGIRLKAGGVLRDNVAGSLVLS